MNGTVEHKKDNQTLNIFIGEIKPINTVKTERKGSRELLLSLRQQQSVSARAISMDALSFLFGKPADHWVFDCDSPFPRLTNHPNIHISISHSGTFVGCVISPHPCGFDLQVHVEKDILGIAEIFFCESEHKMLCRLVQRERKEQFFRLWTLKEAWSKIPGEDFIDTLGNVSFLAETPLPNGHSGRYIRLLPNLPVAVIVRGQSDNLMIWRHNGDGFVKWPIGKQTIEKLT